MEQIRLSLDKNKKYVIACSFGPDSMALLDAAIKEKLNIVVAHVNYRKRAASQFEQDSLTNYCKNHNIKLFILDLLGVKSEGNFQAWARKKRYEFFKEVAEKENAFAVLVAHQQDDVIETYLMQQKRGNYVKKYGISRENELFGVKIIRPLLDYSKEQLKEYDLQNNVPFSIDESNLTDHYTRNQVRHSIVEKMTKDEREKIIAEIKGRLVENIVPKAEFTKSEFLKQKYENLIKAFDYFMQKTHEHRDISEKFVQEIKKAFESNSTQRYEITKSLWLELDYDDVLFVNASKIKPFKFEIERKGNNEFIDIDFSAGADDRGIENLQQKLIIKNCSKNDKLIIKNYSSDIRRLFIDWKMPLYLREVWPGIYDENGQLIYVPRYRKKFKDEHKSKFKINTKYFLEF